MAIIHKRRLSGKEVLFEEIIGNVKDRNVVMVDDMISTAGTICGAAQMVKKLGPPYHRRCDTGLCPAGGRTPAGAPIDEIVVTDTIPVHEESLQVKNLNVLSVAELLGEAIRRIHMNESVSSMFSARMN